MSGARQPGPPRHTPSQHTGVLVYGLGRSGGAVLELLARQGVAASFYDAKADGPDIERADAAGVPRLTPDDLQPAALLAARNAGTLAFDWCIAAPGVRIDHPDLDALRNAGIAVIGEVEWVWRTIPGRYLGVTGTAGKGSVTRWITDVLAKAGLNAIAGGNIDPALAKVATPGAIHVVELSSFQLERIDTFAPEVAVVLNLGEDHLDRHGDVASYHAAKKRILRNLDETSTVVLNRDDRRLREWAAATSAKVLSYSLTPGADAFLAEDGHLILDGQPLLHRSQLEVIGDHQVSNALAVALAAQAAGAPRAAIAAGLEEFRGLPGRYAPAGRCGGVAFIEDSIATRPLAVAAALASTPRPLVWLAGGQDKGSDLESLVPIVAERVDLLVAYGASGPHLAAAFAAATEVRTVAHPDGEKALGTAVAIALEYLEGRHAGRGTVLLAPLAASFDQFDDYAHRAKVFRAVIDRLAKEHA